MKNTKKENKKSLFQRKDKLLSFSVIHSVDRTPLQSEERSTLSSNRLIHQL